MMGTTDVDVDVDVDSSQRTPSAATSQSSLRDGSLFVFNPFGFHSKTSYEATESLLKTRSAACRRREPADESDVWKLPPPDFRPQCYEPRPPPRNSREAIRPWTYGASADKQTTEQTRQSAPVRLPSILEGRPGGERQFVTAFKIDGPWEAKLLYVKDGTFKPGQYQMPKPHDFRGIPSIESLGLPEFLTDYERDPYNLKFVSQRLDILPGDGPAKREERDIRGPQMAPPMSPQLRWDRRLILDRDPFPNKYAAFTRFRRFDRSPHSALMERVEERLNATWAKRKLEKTIQRHGQRRIPDFGGSTVNDNDDDNNNDNNNNNKTDEAQNSTDDDKTPANDE